MKKLIALVLALVYILGLVGCKPDGTTDLIELVRTLLLDIEMGAMDGVTMAKRVRQSNETVQILFITGYYDYIAEGYEVAALHYLMKPVNPEKLLTVLDRAIEKRKQEERCLNLEAYGEKIPSRELCSKLTGL